MGEILTKLNICFFDKKLLEKYNENQEKGSNSIRKKFNTEAVHNKKYLKTKIKS